MSLESKSDGYVLPVVATRLRVSALDWELVAEFVDSSGAVSVSARVESAFTVGGVLYPATAFAEALPVLESRVVDAGVVDHSGLLRITLAGGDNLEVEPSDAFEAWSLTTADGDRIVCMPGGELASWTG